MGFKIFEILLKQEEPIHIGRYAWRVLNETEVFIPGWTIWGALVNFFILENKESITEERLRGIKESLKYISNFFPTIKLNGNFQILFPEYKNGVWGFSLNEEVFIKEEEFRFNFVSADFKTSIEPILRKAKDEHLYEFEFIKPRGKLRNNVVDLYWKGFIIINEDLIKDWIQNIQDKELFIGGDTRYGFGKVKVEEVKEVENEFLNKWNIEIDFNSKKLKLKPFEPSRFFFEFKKEMKIEGELQIIPQLNFRQNTPIIEDAKFFVRVGGKLINSENDLSFILDKGRLLLQQD